MKQFEPQIESVRLVLSDGGRFEVVANDQLLYSKLATGRHANPGEVVELVRDYLKKGI